MRFMLTRFFLVLWLATLAWAQAANGPITQKGLVDALKIGGLSVQELVQFVEKRGVDFQLNTDVERELRDAGAQTDLIDAIKKNFRGTSQATAAAPAPVAAPPPAAKPLAKGEILTLLQVGTPSARIEQLVAARGVAFQVTPEVAREIEAAGGAASLIEAIRQQSGGTTEVPGSAPAPGTAAAAPVTATLRDVRKIFIDKMANDLDQYIRAEIGKQLPGRLTVVLVREEADAFLTGSSEQKSGTGAAITGRYLGLHDNASGAVSIVDKTGRVVLWSNEAGDRSLFWGAVKRGGQRKVADRLVHKLKDALTK
jgi:hypothetical protein